MVGAIFLVCTEKSSIIFNVLPLASHSFLLFEFQSLHEIKFFQDICLHYRYCTHYFFPSLFFFSFRFSSSISCFQKTRAISSQKREQVSGRTGFHSVAQTDLELTMQPKLVSNSWQFPCLCLQSARIAKVQVQHPIQLYFQFKETFREKQFALEVVLKQEWVLGFQRLLSSSLFPLSHHKESWRQHYKFRVTATLHAPVKELHCKLYIWTIFRIPVSSLFQKKESTSFLLLPNIEENVSQHCFRLVC